MSPLFSRVRGTGGPVIDQAQATIGENGDEVNDAPWVNPNNITIVGDGTAATVDLNSDQSSHELSGRAFGLSIPSGATIVGVEATIRQKAGSGDDGRSRTYLEYSGDVRSPSNFSVGAIPTTYTTYVQGGPTELWGITPGVLTPAIVNSDDFEVVLFHDEDNFTNGYNGFCSEIHVKVYYTT